MTCNSAINTIINGYFVIDVVIYRLIIARILEAVIILRCRWIVMNRNGGCRLITHIIHTLLHWFCFLGYFGRWFKRIRLCRAWRNCRYWGSYCSIYWILWSSSSRLRGWFRIINCFYLLMCIHLLWFPLTSEKSIFLELILNMIK